MLKFTTNCPLSKLLQFTNVHNVTSSLSSQLIKSHITRTKIISEVELEVERKLLENWNSNYIRNEIKTGIKIILGTKISLGYTRTLSTAAVTTDTANTTITTLTTSK